MIALAVGLKRVYAMSVPEKSGTGRRNPFSVRRTAPDQAFFYARSNHPNGGVCGAPEKVAGVLTGRHSYPRTSATSFVGKVSGGLQSQLGVPAMSSIIVFSFGSHEIRVTDQDGNPWFVLRDLLAGMASKTTTTRAVESIKQGLGYGVVSDITLQTAGGTQQVIIIAESASTYLLSRSSTDKGRELNRFIHDEVLSAIRKAGSHWLEQLSSSTRPSISTQPPQKVAGVAKNAGFYSLNLALTREKIEESHSTNSSNADMNMGISPSPAAKTKLQYPAILGNIANLATQPSIATFIFQLWATRLGHRAYSAAEVIEQASGILGFTDLLLEIASNPYDSDHVSTKRFGKWLVRNQSWTDGVLRVDSRSRDTNKHIRLWAVRKVSS